MTDVVSKEGRKACWDSRDLYWKCLDENEQSKEKCKSFLQMYEKNCTKTWVKN
jgi:cytochrome c oxidase assembly factor 6